jgi:hypothetical protein
VSASVSTSLCPSSGYLTNTLRKATILDSDLVIQYKDIFIKVKEWGVFQHSDLECNDIHTCEEVPPFVAEFEQKLDKKPGVAPEVCYFLSLAIFLC